MDVRSYDTWEEMRADMARAETAANDRATSQQKKIGSGDAWMNIVAEPFGAEPLFVFGRVQRPWELVRSELLGLTVYGASSDQLAEGKKTAKRVISALGDRHWWSDLVGQPGSDPFALARRFGVAIRGMMPPLRWSDDAEAAAAAVEEFGYTLQSTQQSWWRGYRFSMAFSVYVPEGEFGSTHISNMVPLRMKEFVDAQGAGWDFHRLAHPASPEVAPWARDMVLSGATLEGLHRRDIT